MLALAKADVVKRLERGEDVNGIPPAHPSVGAMCETVACYLRRRNLEVGSQLCVCVGVCVCVCVVLDCGYGCCNEGPVLSSVRANAAGILADEHMRLHLRAVQWF